MAEHQKNRSVMDTAWGLWSALVEVEAFFISVLLSPAAGFARALRRLEHDARRTSLRREYEATRAEIQWTAQAAVDLVTIALDREEAIERRFYGGPYRNLDAAKRALQFRQLAHEKLQQDLAQWVRSARPLSQRADTFEAAGEKDGSPGETPALASARGESL